MERVVNEAAEEDGELVEEGHGGGLALLEAGHDEGDVHLGVVLLSHLLGGGERGVEEAGQAVDVPADGGGGGVRRRDNDEKKEEEEEEGEGGRGSSSHLDPR